MGRTIEQSLGMLRREAQAGLRRRRAIERDCNAAALDTAARCMAEIVTDVAEEQSTFTVADMLAKKGYLDAFDMIALSRIISRACQADALRYLHEGRWEVLDRDALCSVAYRGIGG